MHPRGDDSAISKIGLEALTLFHISSLTSLPSPISETPPARINQNCTLLLPLQSDLRFVAEPVFTIESVFLLTRADCCSTESRFNPLRGTRPDILFTR